MVWDCKKKIVNKWYITNSGVNIELDVQKLKIYRNRKHERKLIRKINKLLEGCMILVSNHNKVNDSLVNYITIYLMAETNTQNTKA